MLSLPHNWRDREANYQSTHKLLYHPMFSKLIAFGAMALALVNAAPTSPGSITVSCNVNLDGAAVSNQVHSVSKQVNSAPSTGKLESGLYHIFNGKLSDGISHNALRSDGAENPVFVFNHESPAPGSAFHVQVLGDYGYVHIFDDAVGLPLGVSKGQIVPVSGTIPEVFALQPSGDKFIIRTKDGRVWTPFGASRTGTQHYLSSAL
ncbi:hypothetical protein MVEN_01852700 [Mycena venus]|uniref:Uncharacterized protein n=1 Tax=Mycena venus TaxID=2733690 RepID=A0A8H6XGQ0_9AGAR|nr:hypothetical protein MVEN_01852700 [Mycena venus]